MRQESNHRMNSGEKESPRISNSRAMGVIILIVLLFVFQVTAFVVQKVRITALEREGVEGSSAGYAARGELFPFDPNDISLDSLQLLGFSPRQAQTILNYRSKGGKFRQKKDFAKMYVVDSAKYHTLAPYILLPDRYSTSPTHLVPKSGISGAKPVGDESLVPKSGVSGAKHAGDESLVPKSGFSGAKHAAVEENALYGQKVERNRYMCNLNTADSAALVRLYGIGGYYARKILRYRELLGGSFVSPRQLLEIEGFTQERYSAIEKSIFVQQEDIMGFSIIKADRKTLERHPYIGPYAARGIVTYLRIKGAQEPSVSGADSAINDLSVPGTGSAARNLSSSGAGSAAEMSARAEQELNLLKELVKERILTPENARKLEEYLLHL